MVFALDAIFLAGGMMFSVVCLSHIAEMWRMRHEFQFAVRSPVLAALSGCSGAFVITISLLRGMLGDYGSYVAIDLFMSPVVLITFTGPYVMRGFRLLVMYNPAMRVRFGTLVKESLMVRTLLVSFAVLEITLSCAAWMFGLERVAFFALIVLLSDSLLTVCASLALFGKLRKTKDIFDMSLEIQKVGVFALAALVIASTAATIPYDKKYFMYLWLTVRFQPSLWFTNIQPVRAALLRGAGEKNIGFMSSLFPSIPWTKHRSSKVSVEAGNGYTLRPRSHSSSVGSVLDLVIHFPPLFQAFEEYCRNALCSESLMFLVDADKFNCSLRAKPNFTGGADPASAAVAANKLEDDPEFELFTAIVDKYIRERSPFEVNIESKTRSEILREMDNASFRKLTLDDKEQLLVKATREVSNMLRENLYHKFTETEQFKQIQEQLLPVERKRGRSNE